MEFTLTIFQKRKAN